ncbi:DEAD/DEAH box helicase [Bailinhaonella thermotolerans]|uniref:DEAD/DEAH box helicase n=1 Tax=Bailinhaonella thermotolerans TaxID=1070861 RepID=A0A3A4BBD4_9ACTN|nr:DEAD/DEAH box helicase [Bailinhaonella thermotolerans]RJL36259.1 DEAD/DEAH box helicase [Bailinhaonella thermotolerans]
METATTADAAEVNGFAALGLPKPIVQALARQGITSPFPIQTACVPDVLAGMDVLGRGQTGSGKTLAFGLPTLARIAGTKARPKHPLAVIMVPTRELAMQVSDALEPLGRGLNIRMKTVVGGTSMGRQIDALRRGVELVVATPGRLTDLVQQGVCSLEEVEVTVLDEADHMCDLGFFPVVTALLEQTPANSQRLLFSATLDGDVDKLVRRFMQDPVTHSIAPATSPVDTMDHHVVQVDPADKFDVIAEIASREGKTILFVRTQHGVDKLVKQLARVGVSAGALHGGKRQNVRTRTLAEFREGGVNVLVATDVAARGIHVDDVSLVLHVDPPADHKSYLHRGGRTARAGERGTVMTLVLPHERRSTDQLTRRAGIKPFRLKAGPGHPRLAEVAGAQAPSGEAVPIFEARPPQRPARQGQRRPARSGDHRGPRRPREGHESGDRPYGERRDFGGDRRESGERRDFGGRRDDRRDFGGRRESTGDRRDDRAPRYGDRRESGERRDFGGDRGRDFGAERRDDRFGGRREFGGERRDLGGDRARADRGFGDRRGGYAGGGERREFGGAPRGEYRPSRQADAGRGAGPRRTGTGTGGQRRFGRPTGDRG